jgi:4-cresol dehydrogenase (hydroxylating)
VPSPAWAEQPNFGFLPDECVISDRSTISRYEHNVTAISRTIPLVLRPQCCEQVFEIIREANRARVSVYSISTGKNWGLGSKLPATNDSLVLDLSELNRILEVNESLRYVVLEPGVTQGQLARYLAAHHPSLSFNLTGAFGETGVLGNALERGDGMYARIDDLIGLGGILGNGERFDVGGNSGENTGRFSRYAAGPDLVGLFTQSNFGVITKMTFRLIAKNERLHLLWGVVDHGRLAELFQRLQGLFAQRVIEPAMTNVGYANRFEQARSTLGESAVETHADSPPWNFYVIVNGTPRISHAVWEESRDALFPCCERIGVYVNGDNSDGLPSFLKPLLQPLCGCPDYDSIKLVYGLTGSAMPSDVRQADLDQTPFGMKSYVAIVPPVAEDVTRAAQIITATKHRLRANIKVSFFGDGRTLVTIHFLKTDPGQVFIAEQAEVEIWEGMNNAGYSPYRVNIGQMERLFELRPQFFNLVSRMKSVFDPNRIIAPGRYCPM